MQMMMILATNAAEAKTFCWSLGALEGSNVYLQREVSPTFVSLNDCVPAPNKFSANGRPALASINCNKKQCFWQGSNHQPPNQLHKCCSLEYV